MLKQSLVEVDKHSLDYYDDSFTTLKLAPQVSQKQNGETLNFSRSMKVWSFSICPLKRGKTRTVRTSRKILKVVEILMSACRPFVDLQTGQVNDGNLNLTPALDDPAIIGFSKFEATYSCQDFDSKRR